MNDTVFTPDDIMRGAKVTGPVLVYDSESAYLGSLILAGASSVAWLYVGALVLAAGLAYNVPLLVLVGAESAPPEDRARVVATITTFGDLANSAGALVLGFVAAGTSYSVMYLVVAVGAVGAAALLHSPFLAPVSGLRRQPVAAS